MSDELSEFLNDGPEPSAEPAEIVAADEAGDNQSEPAEAAPEQDATGDKPQEASPAPGDTPEVAQVPISALHGERDRRQQAERELEAYRQQIARQPAPDPYADPDGYEHHQAQLAQQQQSQQFNQQLEAIRLEDRINITEVIARKTHEDYEQVKDLFVEVAQQNPALAAGLRNSPDPAGFAYEQGLKIKAQREIGDDPAAYKERVRQEVLADIRNGADVDAKAAAEKRASIPNSLVDVRSVTDRSGPEWTGPTALNSILPGMG